MNARMNLSSIFRLTIEKGNQSIKSHWETNWYTNLVKCIVIVIIWGLQGGGKMGQGQKGKNVYPQMSGVHYSATKSKLANKLVSKPGQICTTIIIEKENK